MSKTAADLIRRMDRLSAPPVTPAPAAPAPAPRPSHEDAGPRPRSGGGRRRRAAESSEAVHFTVDLEVELHRALRLFAIDHRTDGSEVIRALIGLLEDPVIADRVIRELEP